MRDHLQLIVFACAVAFAADAAARERNPVEQQDIAAAMKAGSLDIQVCLTPWIRAHPKRVGKLIVHVRISKTGKVDKADVAESDLDDKKAEACVLGVIQRQPFPVSADGPYEIEYPFVIKQGEDDSAAPKPPSKTFPGLRK